MSRNNNCLYIRVFLGKISNLDQKNPESWSEWNDDFYDVKIESIEKDGENSYFVKINISQTLFVNCNIQYSMVIDDIGMVSNVQQITFIPSLNIDYKNLEKTISSGIYTKWNSLQKMIADNDNIYEHDFPKIDFNKMVDTVCSDNECKNNEYANNKEQNCVSPTIKTFYGSKPSYGGKNEGLPTNNFGKKKRFYRK